MTSAISISNLTKRYAAVEAVSALSLEVPEGAIFGFLGANGAGKTSTIKVLAGLSEPTSGAATVAGVSVTAHGEHRRHLGYLGQEPIVMARDRGQVQRTLLGLKLSGNEPVPAGSKVFREEKEIGRGHGQMAHRRSSRVRRRRGLKRGSRLLLVLRRRDRNRGSR